MEGIGVGIGVSVFYGILGRKRCQDGKKGRQLGVGKKMRSEACFLEGKRGGVRKRKRAGSSTAAYLNTPNASAEPLFRESDRHV
jgi:hypothetical protein